MNDFIKKKMQLNKDIETLKEGIKKDIEKAYKDGSATGAVIVCATLYRVLKEMGLNEDNILYDILKDLAKNQGNCDDLPAYIEKMKGGNE